MKTLHDLFLHELHDLYGTTLILPGILDKMASESTHHELVATIQTYKSQAKYQKMKLEEFFNEQSIPLPQAECLIINRLRDHAVESLRYSGSSEIRDIAILNSLNMMKHFEETLFGTLTTHAHRMRHEEIEDLLNSLKKKIAEEENRPIEIASSLLAEGDPQERKAEASALLDKLVATQIEEEKHLLEFLPQIQKKAGSGELIEALETYRSHHDAFYNKLKELPKGAPAEDWEAIRAFGKEWKEDLAGIDSWELEDIAIILSLQRIQHQNWALYEMALLLAKESERKEESQILQECLEREIGHDHSFTAIAEGSLFQEGLDSRVKP